jgi:hypothetical protein
LGQQGCFFVIRHKENLQFETLKENDLQDNRHQHILKDEIICLKNESSKSKYPGKFKRAGMVRNKKSDQKKFSCT